MLIDPQLQRAVSAGLEPNERLLWAGRPDPKRMLMEIHNLVLFGFGVVWTANALSFIRHWHDPDFAFYLFMGSFVVVGVGLMVSPLWAYWEGRRTIYAITDKRMLILVVGKSLKVQSYGEIDTTNMERVERPDGTGDLVVAKKQVKDSDGDTRTVKVKFVGVAGVRAVEAIIKDTFTKV